MLHTVLFHLKRDAPKARLTLRINDLGRPGWPRHALLRRHQSAAPAAWRLIRAALAMANPSVNIRQISAPVAAQIQRVGVVAR